jgi:hypothetical protein
MLTPRDLRWNSRAFSLLSQLNLIPVKFDAVTGRMESQHSIWRKILFKLWEFVFCCYTANATIRTVYMALYSEDPDWDFLPIMLIGSVAYCGIFVVVHTIFDRARDLIPKVYNEIITIRSTKSFDNEYFFFNCVKSKKTLLKNVDKNLVFLLDFLGEIELITPNTTGKRTPLELFITYDPFPYCVSLTAFPVLYSLTLDLSILTISNIPADWRNPVSIALCLSLDVLFHFLTLTWCLFAVFVIMSFVMTFKDLNRSATSKIMYVKTVFLVHSFSFASTGFNFVLWIWTCFL